MFLQSLEKQFIQCYSIIKQIFLRIPFLPEEEAASDDGAALEAVAWPAIIIGAGPEELDRAGRDPARLVPKRPRRLPAHGDPHASHPVAHRAAQADVGAAGPNGLGLKVDQNHPGAGAVRDAKERCGAGACFEPAGLDEKGDGVPPLFPNLRVAKAFVREAGKAKSGVRDAEVLGIVGEGFRGNVDEAPLPCRHHLPRLLAAVLEDKVVDVPHGTTIPSPLPSREWVVLIVAVKCGVYRQN